MAKRLYNRETIDRIYEVLKRRIELYPYENLVTDIKDVIVYGSYVDKSVCKLHNLNVCVVYQLKEKYEKMNFVDRCNAFYKLASKKFEDVKFDDYTINIYPYYEMCQFIREDCNKIMITTLGFEREAKAGPHIYLIKDGKALKEPLECEGE